MAAPEAAARRDTLFVCRTCPREAWRTGRAAGEGERLAAALRTGLAESALGERLGLLVVHCLSGCPKPCNIALVGPGKPYLRFARLGPADAPAILDLAGRFCGSRAGDPGELPSGLAGRLSLRLAPGIVAG
jgi:predicted metal-binding protein